eukprot:6212083-Pleurochrysis_carterae.AAC.2
MSSVALDSRGTLYCVFNAELDDEFVEFACCRHPAGARAGTNLGHLENAWAVSRATTGTVTLSWACRMASHGVLGRCCSG